MLGGDTGGRGDNFLFFEEEEVSSLSSSESVRSFFP